MKKVLICLLVVIFQNAYSQESQEIPSVEKSIYGIQTGLLGIWVHNESKLSNSISLRSEIGLDLGININFDTETYGLIPSLRLEPRWYYNLNNRIKKGKSIKNNTANFFTIATTYNPKWFLISNQSRAEIIPQITFIPKWGIKRTVGKHFTYEAGLGIGYLHYLDKNYNEFNDNVGADLHLRIGYTF